MPNETPNLEAVTAFLDAVEIDPSPPDLEAFETADGLLPPKFDEAKKQSVVIGSQIADFNAEVPVGIRPLISNVFLLAQLVADKKTSEQGSDSKKWYNHYLETLSKVGWQVNLKSDAMQVVKGTSVEVHKEIIPILTAALGPAVAASSMIVTILKGLNNIDKDQPWITLFSRKSQRVSANQFQFSHTSMEFEIPVVTLVAFELNASRSVTQVLFFKLATSQAKLVHFEQKMAANPLIVRETGPKVEKLVLEHVSKNIADIGELGL